MARNFTDVNFLQEVKRLPNDIDKMLEFCTKNGCSDLFIKVGETPYVYKHGVMYQALKKTDIVQWNKWTKKAMTSEMNTMYIRSKMFDFQYTYNNHRYRVNASYSTNQNIATFRMISDRLPTFQTLNIEPNLRTLLTNAFNQKQGITMLVGVTGSGKTSTLASCINTFSSTASSNESVPLKDAHLITLEDPIEYLYPSTDNTRIVQKELATDFKSYDLGIKSALREHPTHILVGETRDAETIKSLIQATITGHSVITTFHSSDVATTISRLYSQLISDNKDVIFDLISCMNFILCQRLLKSRKGYLLNYQYMFFTPNIKKILTEAIYEDKNIPNVINTLINNKALLQNNIVHDWRYGDKK